jgi:hypothetical protein
MTAQQRRDRHAAYMGEYNRRDVPHGNKLLRNRDYRKRNLAKIQAYDRRRSKLLSRRAAKFVYSRKRRERKREELISYSKAYYQKNKHLWKTKTAKRKALYTKEEWKDIQARYGLKHRHGMTSEQYNTLLVTQGNRCALCRSEHGSSGNNGKLHVDHDYKTGRNRALLCMRSNMAIERLHTIPGWIREAQEYLKSADAEKILGVPTFSRPSRPR